MSDILTMWREGKDTLQIAKALNTDEHVIYNKLANLRGQLLCDRVPKKERTEVAKMSEAQKVRRDYMDKMRLAGIPIEERRKATAKYLAEMGLA